MIFFKVACSSKLTLDQHLLGRRHLRRVAQRKAQQEQQREPQELPVFNCTLCDVTAPSQEVMILIPGLIEILYSRCSMFILLERNT